MSLPPFMENTNTTPSVPETYAQLVQRKNWGGANVSSPLDPNRDHYIAGTVPNPNWTPSQQDWELLASMGKTKQTRL